MANEEKEKREEILKEFADKNENVKEQSKEQPKDKVKDSQIGPGIEETPDAPPMPWQKEAQVKRELGNNLGWIPIKIEDLPTRGLFYPEKTEIAIRAASGGEIRHWSTLQEDDFSALDNMLNYIIERCVTIKPTNPEDSHLSWKDIKEVDRFYLLLAVHELTFAEGENNLQVKIADNKNINVQKEMVSYISLDPRLMRYYNDKERCFILTPKGGKPIKLDIPSIGVTQWLKNYIIRKQTMGEPIDEDYLNFAPFIIRDWRGLNDNVYNNFVEESYRWNVTIISLLVHVKKLFSDTVDPVIRYTDEGGMEQVAPLNFQGGIKSLFLISDPFAELE